MEQLNKNNWEIESLRLTSFLKNDFKNSLMEDWLVEISKNEPLSINKTLNSFQGLAIIDSAMIKLECNNNRIDLFLSANAPMIESYIGKYTDIKRLFLDVLFAFFNVRDCPISKRIALGVILNIPINDIDEGVDILESNLKSVKNIKGTTDFLFRINKPIQSEASSEVRLNRLMTWSIGNLQLINIRSNIDHQIFGQPNVIPTSINKMICRLEMDFNTVVREDIELSLDDQKKISLELLTEAMNVAENGEY